MNKRQESMRQYLCTIENDIYHITQYFNSPNKYFLLRNEETVASIKIIRVEYENWKGHQIKYKQIPWFCNTHMSEYDKIALEDAMEFVNSLNLDYSKLNF